MKSSSKLSSEERRQAIIRAVRRVFADKGFHGTTTRELADAAGVSEALLFKHFPHKEALYSAMQMFCSMEQDPEKLERIKGLEPSTSTLVLIVHMMIAKTVGRECQDDEDAMIHHRLMLRSLIEDGEFARLFFQKNLSCWMAKVEECLEASTAAGEAIRGPLVPKLGALFAWNLARAIMFSRIPARPLVDYGVPRATLVEQAVWFTLRGLGVTDKAIKRYYNPEGWTILAD
ncbi:MAG TPA: helix-turn-helix domain-containing protein [Isosphaeraceae bacterium]|nr:helix-turn-helix domain-containing protein [Isosphaeraceae bacterium]